nr:movement protein [Grapevine Muscat rose virus]
MSSFKIIMMIFAVLMIPSSEIPLGINSKLPIYDDDEQIKSIREKARKNPEIARAYDEALQNKEIWANTKMDEYKNDNVDKLALKLGDAYSLKDFRVRKTYEQDIQIKGGKTEMQYRPIDVNERLKMSAKYRTVHLDGIMVNCESLMPKGSEGFAIMTLYDERFISQEKGFLGLIGFPLSHGVSKASLKINYSISTADNVNWVAIITVYDHCLRDDMRPCNFHLKAFYKYTNNVRRFIKDEEKSEIGTFKIEIQKDKRGFAEESIRNSLDYSMTILMNRQFMKTLSDRELRCLNRSISERQILGRQVPNYEASCSTSRFKTKEVSDDCSQSSNSNTELKIDFENMTKDEMKKFITENLNSQVMENLSLNKPRQLKL